MTIHARAIFLILLQREEKSILKESFDFSFQTHQIIIHRERYLIQMCYREHKKVD